VEKTALSGWYRFMSCAIQSIRLMSNAAAHQKLTAVGWMACWCWRSQNPVRRWYG